MTEERTPEASGVRRRGRRPGGADTRSALLAAAREEFVESGYAGATVRSIAGRAGVDPAMVNHWFGGKERLFAEAVLALPFDPVNVIDHLLEGDVAEIGERLVRTFLSVWDSSGGGVFVALMRSVTAREEAAQVLYEFLMANVFDRVVTHIRTDHGKLRATLCASQVMGLGMVRYVTRFEPLASADVETVVAAVAPNVQRYLTGDLGTPG